MNRDAMQSSINNDLERIPRGEKASPQNLLRMTYQDMRAHDLKENPDTPRESTLRKALDFVRKEHPGFAPQYDRAYFGNP